MQFRSLSLNLVFRAKVCIYNTSIIRRRCNNPIYLKTMKCRTHMVSNTEYCPDYVFRCSYAISKKYLYEVYGIYYNVSAIEGYTTLIVKKICIIITLVWLKTTPLYFYIQSGGYDNVISSTLECVIIFNCIVFLIKLNPMTICLNSSICTLLSRVRYRYNNIMRCAFYIRLFYNTYYNL